MLRFPTRALAQRRNRERAAVRTLAAILTPAIVIAALWWLITRACDRFYWWDQ